MLDQLRLDLKFFNLEIHQIHLLARATERQAEADLERLFGLTLLESRIVAIVACVGALPFRQLVAHAQFDKSHVSRLVTGLVKKGLIISETDPDDQRAAILRLTKEGQELFLSIHELATRHNELWLSSLTKAGRAGLKAALTRLVQLSSDGSAHPDHPPAPARTRQRRSRPSPTSNRSWPDLPII